jgi:hypothetical protein
LPIFPAERLSPPGPFQGPPALIASYIPRRSSTPSRQQQALLTANPRRPHLLSHHLFALSLSLTHSPTVFTVLVVGREANLVDGEHLDVKGLGRLLRLAIRRESDDALVQVLVCSPFLRRFPQISARVVGQSKTSSVKSAVIDESALYIKVD